MLSVDVSSLIVASVGVDSFVSLEVLPQPLNAKIPASIKTLTSFDLGVFLNRFKITKLIGPANRQSIQ